MRTLGIAILGVFAGVLAGLLVFNELLGRLLVASGSGIDAPLAFVIGFGPMVFAAVGAVVAVLIDQRIRRSRP